MSLRSAAYSFFFSIVVIALGSGIPALKAQPVVSAANLSLGGGGAAYLTGYESSFYNPANLMIYDRKGRLHFGIGGSGGYFQPVLSSDNLINQAKTFRNVYTPYRSGSQTITPAEREWILEHNYPRRAQTAQHQARIDLNLVGVHWQGDKQAYSLAGRTRMATRSEIGRGWYSNEFIEEGDNSVRNFHLTVQRQVLHEVSLGIAHEFEFINGLFPRINKLYVGIAPKFMIGGAYQNTSYKGRYETADVSITNQYYVDSFIHHSSGNYSEMIKSYRRSRNLPASISQHMDDEYFFLRPTGYGLGIDFGLTYLIPLGSDVSILDEGKNRYPIEKSLRVALSVTDLGLMYYQSSPLTVEAGRDTSYIQNQEPLQSGFIGAPGQFSAFFGEATSLVDPLISSDNVVDDSFSSLLPTSVNAGALLDLNRFKLMGDLTLALNKTAFAGTQLTAHIGTEIRPLSFIPIRLGTTVAKSAPSKVGFGTGFETRYWNFYISSQVLLRKDFLTSEVVGGAVAGLQFHM